MNDTDIAIIGLALRFPGAKTPDEFWRNLVGGVHALKPLTDAELEAGGVPAEHYSRQNYVRAAYAVEDIDQFDAKFFGISPREAQVMDPQHRLMLECAWESLEDAGYNVKTLREGTAVFAGTFVSSYWAGVASDPALVRAVGPLTIRHANDKDYLATRISYKLDLTGPSFSVQTSCSTALAAVHQACQSLLAGACDVALAGGVSISVPQNCGYVYEQGGLLSPDAYCRPFDRGANGTAFGSGAGVVVLKRADAAQRDRDRIYAVIKGSAANNDGARKVGFTAPSVEGQAQAIAEALLVAGVPFDSISYVEAHGTATPMGDPIEIEALTQAFREGTARTQFCGIGSVKSNIGHCGAASGIAGLIKTALAMHHRRIPPTLHFESPNPAIDFESSPFYVVSQLQDWDVVGGPRRAGVSSFGMGGTNVHVVLEEAPIPAPRALSPRAVLLPISAASPRALAMARQRLAAAVQTGSVPLVDAAFTLQHGRVAFGQRDFVVARTSDDAIARLAMPSAGVTAQPERTDVVFLFSGQGTQYPGMARGLYEEEPTFRREFDRLAGKLMALGEPDLRARLFGAVAEEAWLSATENTQPVLFALGYALARTWQSYGVRPIGMLGHSLGEYTAACLAGVFDEDDALRLVVARGRIFGALRGGAMLSVQADRAAIDRVLAPGAEIAAINGPRAFTLAGAADAIAALEQKLQEQSMPCTRLRTSQAFHSAALEPVLDEFRDVLATIQFHTPNQAFVSNVSGTWAAADEVNTPEYWVRHSRQPVQFAAGVATLLAVSKQPVPIEIGPGTTLVTLAAANVPDGGLRGIASLRHPKDERGDYDVWLAAIGEAWKAGVEIDWSAMPFREARRVSLPTYPFERERYWVPPRSGVPQAPNSVVPSASKPKWVRSSWSRGAWLRPTWVRNDAPPRYLFAGERTLTMQALIAAATAHGRLCWDAEAERAVIPPTGDIPTSASTHGSGLTEAFDAFVAGEVRLILAIGGMASEETEVALRESDTTATRRIDAIASALVRRGRAFECNVITRSRAGNEFLHDETTDCAAWTRLVPAKNVRHIDVIAESDAPRLGEALVAECESPFASPAIVLASGRRYVRNDVPATSGAGDARLCASVQLEVQCDELKRQLHAYLPSDSNDAGAAGLVSVLGPHYDVTCADANRLAAWWTAAADRVKAWGERLGQMHLPFHVVVVTGHPALYGSAAMYQARLNRAIVRAAEAAAQDDPNCRTVFVDLGCYRWSAVASGTVTPAAAAYQAEHGIDVRDAAELIAGAIGFAPGAFRVPARSDDAVCLSPSPMANSEVGGTNNELESLVARIFGETLGHPVRDPDQSFFDAGGNSLTAFQAVARLRQAVGREIPLAALLERPTARGVAAAIAADGGVAATPIAPVESATLQEVMRVFADVLGRTDVGPDDHFFQIGGNSLSAFQTVSRLRQRFEVELPLADVLANPTPRGIAALIPDPAAAGVDADAALVDELMKELDGASTEAVRQHLGTANPSPNPPAHAL